MKQLFKYSPSPYQLFSEGFIRLSQLSVLNDPFEASFCDVGLKLLANEFDHPIAHDAELGEIDYSDYVEKNKHKIGVICLSENKENLLMWAHYSDEHKGLIAGIKYVPFLGSIFENLKPADIFVSSSLPGIWSPFDGVPRPVNYRKGLRYRNDRYDYDYSNISAEGADRLLYEVFMQKSDEWIYEQEYRVVLRLEQADRVIVPDINNVVNKKIKKLIIKSPHTHIEAKSNAYVVDLINISDETERALIACELSKLSRNLNTIYLMKLSRGSLNCCLLGLNALLQSSEVIGDYVSQAGNFNIWKARKNLDHYSLEFDEI